MVYDELFANLETDSQDALKWIAAEFNYLNELKTSFKSINSNEDISKEKKACRKAVEIFRYVARCERKANRELDKVIQDLEKVIKLFPQLVNFENQIKINKNKLLKAFSFYSGDFKKELRKLTIDIAIIESKKRGAKKVEDEVKFIVDEIEKSIDDLLKWLDALVINLKEVISFERKISKGWTHENLSYLTNLLVNISKLSNYVELLSMIGSQAAGTYVEKSDVEYAFLLNDQNYEQSIEDLYNEIFHEFEERGFELVKGKKHPFAGQLWWGKWDGKRVDFRILTVSNFEEQINRMTENTERFNIGRYSSEANLLSAIPLFDRKNLHEKFEKEVEPIKFKLQFEEDSQKNLKELYLLVKFLNVGFLRRKYYSRKIKEFRGPLRSGKIKDVIPFYGKYKFHINIYLLSIIVERILRVIYAKNMKTLIPNLKRVGFELSKLKPNIIADLDILLKEFEWERCKRNINIFYNKSKKFKDDKSLLRLQVGERNDFLSLASFAIGIVKIIRIYEEINQPSLSRDVDTLITGLDDKKLWSRKLEEVEAIADKIKTA
ncbi:MAG: hypothetical protein KJ771_07130 [Nanoarchaeota archaeon]|nr:hypothetical protein [Nanoarchaeota archaeon]